MAIASQDEGQDGTDTRATAVVPHALLELVDGLQDGFFVLDREWRFLYVNVRAARDLGREPARLVGCNVWELFPALLGTEQEVAYRKAMDQRVSVSLESPDGLGKGWSRFAISPAAPGIAVVRTDVTDRRRAEEALRASEQKFAKAFHLSTSAMAVTRLRDGVMLEVNDRYLEVTGLAREALVGNTALRAGIWKSAEDRADFTGELQRHGTVRNREYRFGRPGGEDWSGLVSAQLGELEGETIVISSIADITENKRVEEVLRENEARFSAIYDHAPYAIALIQHPEGTLAAVNEAWERMFGYSRAQALGRTSVELGLAADPEGRERMYAEIRARGSVRDFELAYANRSGERRLAAFSFDRIEIGGRLFQLGTAIDVTERRRAEEALLDANRRKDEFLGILSHELRNPLAPIRNSVYVLEHAAPGSEQASRARAVLRRQSEHLTRLVDDLLDVTRIARGKIELRRSRTDLREAVWRAAEDFRLMMEERGVAFRTALPDGKTWADVDPTRINQVVGNLLHNAAKYTRRGDEVTLSLRANQGLAELRVRDTGAGIEASLLPHVFEAFVQGDRTLSRTEGGLGLGLALVKGIVELHGGEVAVESAGIGKGAEFVARFPLREGATAGPRGAAGAGAGAANGSRRVLVVDDNVDAAETLADLLRLLGHEVEVAHDGPGALEKLRAGPPEVVFCDIGLPGMNGYEVARAMRASHGDDLQLVALTGYAQAEDVKRAIEAGFDAHVAKPPDLAQIEKLLE